LLEKKTPVRSGALLPASQYLLDCFILRGIIDHDNFNISRDRGRNTRQTTVQFLRGVVDRDNKRRKRCARLVHSLAHGEGE